MGKAEETDRAPSGRVPLECRDARVERWRGRAKRLVRIARDAQFELLAKQIRYTALVAVMTEAELADFNARIKKYQLERRASFRPGNAARSAAPPSPDSPPADPLEKK